jgi:glyoxylase-like metal-dependent hydrolase (beta-lactamase superfamily II)
MATREAACHCGQLRLEVEGDPFSVSICNCLACQRRTGSAFGMQAGYRADQVRVDGRFNDYSRISDEADRKEHVFHFCPECGSQVFYTEPDDPNLIVVSIGSFADPSFPPPTESGYDSRRHRWVELPESIHRSAPELWDAVRPLYEAGKYAEAAERGRELLEARPDQAYLFYNVACCESLAGQTAEALEHLRRSIEMWDGCRNMARGDSDFDPIRGEPTFEELMAARRARTDIVSVRELEPGLWHWQAPHPDWRSSEPWEKEVSSYAIDDGARLLLFDPLGVPTEIEALAAERETTIVLTAPWHERDTQSLVEQFGAPVYAPPPDTGEDLMRTFDVPAEQAEGFVSPDLMWLFEGGAGDGHQYLAGDRLPFGVETFPGWTHNDVVLWVESRRVVIAGDTLADFGGGIEINTRWLRGGVTREQVVDGLRPLLELPVERILASHGGPFDRAALERALA